MAADAARAEALSTAFMVMTAEEVKDFCREARRRAGTAHPAGDDAAGQAERIIPVGKWEAGELLGNSRLEGRDKHEPPAETLRLS